MNKNRPKLALIFLALAILACASPGWVQTPEPLPTLTPIATDTPLAIPQALAIATEGKLPTDTPAVWYAAVKLPTVNVRKTANGESSGTYLAAGDLVTIVQCTDDWCQISKPVEGYVFRGCLSDNPENLGCTSK